MSEFGNFIETKRKKLGKTLRELAKELGISVTYICDIEKGNRKPSDNTFYTKLAQSLNLNKSEIAEFYDLAADKSKSEAPQDIADYINKFPMARAALRVARDCNVSDKDWKRLESFLIRRK